MIKRHLMLAPAALLLSSCALTEVGTKIDSDRDATAAMQALVERNAGHGGIIRTSRPRLAGEEVTVKVNSLPAGFSAPVSYVTRGAQSVVQTLEDVSLATGIAIRTAEIADLARGQSGGPSAAMNGGPISGNVAVEYTGTARGLLDEIAVKANVAWRYNQITRSVEFYRFETRTLSIDVPPGAKSVSAGISLGGVSGGGGGSGGGSGGASAGNVAVNQTLTIDPWTSIMKGIESILSQSEVGAAGQQGMPMAPTQGGGAAMSAMTSEGSAIANPELGLVTVTARPAVMARVARYVRSINARFAQNILIDVKIMSVTLNSQAAAGFSLNMLYNPIGKLGGQLVGPAPLEAGAGSPGVLTLVSNKPGSWNGSQLVAQALGQFGKVSLQQQGQVLAVNGQPSPMQVADEINYTSGASVVPQNGNQGAIITKTQSTKVVGFTANFIPLVLSDNRISLAYQLNLSTLTGMTQAPDGVQSPRIASKSLPGHAFMRDGQAIVLFGYGEERDSSDGAVALGGLSRAVTRDRQLTVIVVQVNTGVKNEQI